jgi:diguanylate cyclase (GGDEF)-like protein
MCPQPSKGEPSRDDWTTVARGVEEALHPQRKLLAELMHSCALADGDIARALQQVTEAAAAALRVPRASVWRLCGDDAGQRIECVDLFESLSGRHTAGLTIAEATAPRYFRALAGERAIAAHDAATDPRTSEFADSYLRPLGITAMLDAPVFVRGKMVAVVCHEHVGGPRHWQFWEELIAGTCADFVALVLESQGWATAERALRAERDALERKVAERTAELAASEQALRTLIDVSPVALVLSRQRDHTIVFANARAFALFEVAPGTPLALDAGQFWPQPEDRQRFLAAVAAGRVDGFEVELRTQTGRLFWARLSADRLSWQGEAAVLASVDDITLHKRAETQLRELAARDVLTGVHNRRSLTDAGLHELDRARRYDRPLTVAMIDVDHFKQVNDAHGHAVGDEVLRAVVRGTQALLRGSDLLGRWGGEEFVVVLPETALGAAQLVLDRVRAALETTPTLVGDLRVSVTVSIGIAEWTGIESLQSLVERADQACYAAKRAGRNRVELALPR